MNLETIAHFIVKSSSRYSLQQYLTGQQLIAGDTKGHSPLSLGSFPKTASALTLSPKGGWLWFKGFATIAEGNVGAKGSFAGTLGAPELER